MTRQPFGFSYKSDTIFRPDEPSAGGAVSMYGQGKPNKSREGKVTLEMVRNGNKIKFKRIPYKGNEEVDSMITNNTTATATANNDFNAFKKGMQEMCINQVTEYLGEDKAIKCLIQASENKSKILDYLKSSLETETVLDILMKAADPSKRETKADGKEFINRIMTAANPTVNIFRSSDEDAEMLDAIIEQIPTLRKGKGRYGVACRKFLETVLNNIDPEGKLVKYALQIMVDGFYHMGRGVILSKVLPFVSVMAYHEDRLDDVARELDSYVKQHSFQSLEIDSNREIKFLDHMDITMKISLYLEQLVCEKLSIPTEMIKRNNI